jgi:RecA-family ATPase
MDTSTSSARPSLTGIAELIREAHEHPPSPVIEGLLNEHEVAGLHGSPESFKTILTLHLAEAIATAQPFLGIWRVPEPRIVYFFETEMSTSALGKRLSAMFQGRTIPERVKFASKEQLRQFKRAAGLAAKFALLREWVAGADAEVVIIDTCNPFFRGKESPNDETTAGEFFDRLEAITAPTKFFVRHNRKPRMDDYADDSSRIRGSGQFADVPDLLLELRRTDRRTNKAELAVTKFRHGAKSDNVSLWFDSGELRLIALPPVIHLLESGALTRQEMLEGLSTRFGVEQRLGDSLIDPQRPFLQERQRGHSRVFEIDREAARSAEWFHRISQGPSQAR